MVRFKLSEEFAKQINKLFLEQKKNILKLLPHAKVKHIGSTSLRNALTKGDLDVLVTISDKNFKSAIRHLKKAYRANQLNNWTENYASFKNVKLKFGIQLVTPSNKSGFSKHLALFKQPEFLKKYNALKRRYHGKSTRKYRMAKEKFFKNLKT